jgi:hypothetical protein
MLWRSGLFIVLVALLPTAACIIEGIPGRECSSSTDCTEPGYAKCDTRWHTCVPDSFDLDMGAGDGADLAPIECTMSSTCPAGAPVCTPAELCGSCGAVGASTECNTYHPTTPLCGPNGGCVACLLNDDCDALHETCGVSHACVACVANADCTSGLCTAGACADKSTLLYVNNAVGGGCSDGGAGTFTMPFCTVQKGLNAAAMTGKQLVVFAGTYTENVQATTALNGGNDYIASAIGVGAPVIKPAASGEVLAVFGTAGKQTTVAFDGFVFDGSPLADGKAGITCNGSGAAFGKTLVTVTRSTIKRASGIGLNAQAQCTLTLDADTLSGNGGGGIKVDSCDVALTNLLIHDNGTSGAGGSTFGGIDFAAAGEAGKTNLFNLTIVDNSSSGAQASGIYCAAAPSTLQNTLILGATPSFADVSTACAPTYSAFPFVAGPASNNENIPLTGCAVSDLLVDPANGDYHPKKGGTPPCTLVDQALNSGAPDHDLDGTSRPQPASGTDDIGCYEAK